MVYNCKLIGYPIKHSLSPWIHEQFFEKAELQGTYTINEIRPEDSFEDHIKRMREEQVDGFNITVPYKQAIIPYLDVLDETAKKMGAVNTVVNRNGKWIGYNTDGIGYLRSLESMYPDLFTDKSVRVLLLGAGGAARAIYFALDVSGFTRIDIANRTRASAKEIIESANSSTQSEILSLEEAEKYAGNYDLIIQTTSVGMKPKQDNAIISSDNIKTNTIVSDIVYQPIQTKFLSCSAKRGAMIHQGHTMLLYQAQYAFEIWTDKKVKMDDMEIKLKEILEG